MLYNRVLEYSKRENLRVELDFEMKKIHWIIQLDNHGKMSGPSIPNTEEVVVNEKTKQIVKTMLVPYSDPNYMSVPTNPEYYFLIGQSSVLLCEDDKQSSVDKLNFIKKVLLKAGNNHHTKSLLKFFNNPTEMKLVLDDLKEQKMKPIEWLTFMIDGELLINNNEVKSFWKQYRKDNSRTNSTLHRCFLTGEMKPCVDKFTKIATLPKLGAVDLSGMGQDSFNHYGMENITIGIEEDNLIKLGLYDLLNKYGVYSQDIVYVGWTKNKVDEPVGLDFLNQPPDSEAVKKLLTSTLKGEEYDLTDDNEYYLYGLTVRSGRLVIVEEHSISLNKVQRNIKQWFEKMGNTKYSIYQLTKSIETESDGEGAKNNIWKNYYRNLLISSILNKPISREIWNVVLHLILINLLKNNVPKNTRLSLLKLCLGSVNENSIGYKTGVVFGKYSNLHRLSMGSTGNTGGNVVDGMLQGIINRPKYSYETIKKRFDTIKQFYTEKINERFPNRGTQLYNELETIGFEIPERLTSLEDIVSEQRPGADSPRHRRCYPCRHQPQGAKAGAELKRLAYRASGQRGKGARSAPPDTPVEGGGATTFVPSATPMPVRVPRGLPSYARADAGRRRDDIGGERGSSDAARMGIHRWRRWHHFGGAKDFSHQTAHERSAARLRGRRRNDCS